MASRKDQKEKLRQERLEREAAAAKAASRRQRLGYVVAGVLVAAVVIALASVALSGGGDGDGATTAKSSGDWPDGSIPARKISDLDAAVKAAGCTLEKLKDQGRGHTTEPQKYKSEYPTSGTHDPEPARDRATLKSPGAEKIVHSLEHGRVVYWWRPGAAPSVIGALKKLYDEDNVLMLLAPYEGKPKYEVAATAWTRILGCPTYNDKVPDAFRAFRDEYRLKGPEYVPNSY